MLQLVMMIQYTYIYNVFRIVTSIMCLCIFYIVGYALRNCLVNGSWANVVNISSCSTPVFESLSLQAVRIIYECSIRWGGVQLNNFFKLG